MMTQLREHIVETVRLSLALAAMIGVVWGMQNLRQDVHQQGRYPATAHPTDYSR
ncbi:hypothetical protein [Gloeomargarita sp.]